MPPALGWKTGPSASGETPGTSAGTAPANAAPLDAAGHDAAAHAGTGERRPRIALVGNINNPETLFAKGPETVHEEVVRNLEAGVQLIGPECAIPLQTQIENLLQIPKTIKEWHADRPGASQ